MKDRERTRKLLEALAAGSGIASVVGATLGEGAADAAEETRAATATAPPFTTGSATFRS